MTSNDRGITSYIQLLRSRNTRIWTPKSGPQLLVQWSPLWRNWQWKDHSLPLHAATLFFVIAWVLSSDYRWRRPYTITTMIGLEVVHWGFLQEGGSCQGYVFCAKGRKSIQPTHWYPVSGTSLSNCELWNEQKLAASVL